MSSFSGRSALGVERPGSGSTRRATASAARGRAQRRARPPSPSRSSWPSRRGAVGRQLERRRSGAGARRAGSGSRPGRAGRRRWRVSSAERPHVDVEAQEPAHAAAWRRGRRAAGRRRRARPAPPTARPRTAASSSTAPGSHATSAAAASATSARPRAACGPRCPPTRAGQRERSPPAARAASSTATASAGVGHLGDLGLEHLGRAAPRRARGPSPSASVSRS